MQYSSDLHRAQAEQIRRIVREEIAEAFRALGREAEHQDMPYETGELESSALHAVKRVAEGTVARLTCEHGEYNTWRGETRCDKCGEPEPTPVDPFKEGS